MGDVQPQTLNIYEGQYNTKHEAGLENQALTVATMQMQLLEYLSVHPLHGSEPAQEFAGCEVCGGIDAPRLPPAPHSSFAPQHHWLCMQASEHIHHHKWQSTKKRQVNNNLHMPSCAVMQYSLASITAIQAADPLTDVQSKPWLTASSCRCCFMCWCKVAESAQACQLSCTGMAKQQLSLWCAD